jgi:hypothetical protein
MAAKEAEIRQILLRLDELIEDPTGRAALATLLGASPKPLDTESQRVRFDQRTPGLPRELQDSFTEAQNVTPFSQKSSIYSEVTSSSSISGRYEPKFHSFAASLTSDERNQHLDVSRRRSEGSDHSLNRRKRYPVEQSRYSAPVQWQLDSATKVVIHLLNLH